MQAVTERQPLTAKQQSVYDFIKVEINERLSPTVREIGDQFGIRSSNGVMCHLRAIERKGWIKRDPYLSRGIALMPEPKSQIVTIELDESFTIGDVVVSLISVVDMPDGHNVMLEVIAPDTMGELSKDV